MNDAIAAQVAPSPLISIVLCTYNRADLLPLALSQLAAQITRVQFEVIVVDNNSTDSTRAVIEEVVRANPVFHYLFEAKQGLSHARNLGVMAARGAIVAFTDDDVAVASDWVDIMARAFDDPQVACIGGKVLPQWPAVPPAWLTRIHWSPLALVDRGDDPIVANMGRPLVFVGANLAVRKDIALAAGLFDPDLQRVKDGIGSTEDHEFLLRVYRAGHQGRYVPTLTVHTPVQADRLGKSYHRRWHAGHGRFMARMGLVAPDAVSPNLFGLPSYYYSGLLSEAVAWVKARWRGDEALAFHHELELRSAIHFVGASRRLHMPDGSSTISEVGRFIRGLMRKKFAALRDVRP